MARPQSSSLYIGEADVLDGRGCRSRLQSGLEHGDVSSRLLISLRISGVSGSIEFSRLCIYSGLAARQVEYQVSNLSNPIYSMLRIYHYYYCDFYYKPKLAYVKRVRRGQL